MLTFLLVLLSLSYRVEAQFILKNSAIPLGNDCYQLTPDEKSTTGQIWNEKKLDLEKDFTIEATINLGAKNSGADGITFILQSSCLFEGSGAGGIGVSGIKPSFIVEFDTFRNSSQGDPPDESGKDHIAMFRNGVIKHNSFYHLNNDVGSIRTVVVDDMENGEDIPVRFTWIALDKSLGIYYMDSLILRYKVNMFNDIFGDETLVYWGFTAGTGGSSNKQSVCITSFPRDEALVDNNTCSLSIENFREKSIDIFPNPVRNILHVNFKSEIITPSLELFDLNGKQIKVVNNMLLNNNISLNSLASGTYFIKIRNQQRVIINKILKL